MGGRGTWYFAYRYPERFAAIAPISAFQTIPAAWSKKLRDMPIWAFHGADDTITPLEDDQEMIDALIAVGGSPKFTVLPNRGHNLADVYKNQALYDWFLEHRKKR